MYPTSRTHHYVFLMEVNPLAIPVNTFLERVAEIAREKPRYRKGGSGKDGTCDCIGLIIGALRRTGATWTGIHGSNYAARKETTGLREIRSTSELQPGELVFKHTRPGQKSYDLPARYRNGGTSCNGDLLDYYHVGVVLSASPLRICHVTGTGAELDTSLGKWSHHGWCKSVAAAVQSMPAALALADTSANLATPDSSVKTTLTPDSETVVWLLHAMGQIEKQLDLMYEALGGRG